MGTTESTRDKLAAASQMVSLFIMEFAPGGTNIPAPPRVGGGDLLCPPGQRRHGGGRRRGRQRRPLSGERGRRLLLPPEHHRRLLQRRAPRRAEGPHPGGTLQFPALNFPRQVSRAWPMRREQSRNVPLAHMKGRICVKLYWRESRSPVPDSLPAWRTLSPQPDVAAPPSPAGLRTPVSSESDRATDRAPSRDNRRFRPQPHAHRAPMPYPPASDTPSAASDKTMLRDR